jgi:hypothetical protein
MTFPSATPQINVTGLLSSPVTSVGIAPWASNYTASGFIDLGALDDIQLAHEIKTAPITADNVRAVIGVMKTDESFKISGKLKQFDLKMLSMLTGSSASGGDVAIVDWVTGATDGTVTWGRGSVDVDQYYTVQLHIEGLSLKYSWGGNAGADVYTKADIIIPRARPNVKTQEAFKIGSVVVTPFELEAVFDSSVTTAGTELFKIVLTKPK